MTIEELSINGIAVAVVGHRPLPLGGGSAQRHRVRIYGNGRCGSAYADRLCQRGYPVTVYDLVDGELEPVTGPADEPALLAILAVPRGTDVPDMLTTIDSSQVPCVIDLTTQSPALAISNAGIWSARGGRSYHAGGSNGGERAIRSGESYLLLGPPTDREVWAVMRDVAYLTEFPNVEDAVTLKLCHNAFLVIENQLADMLAAVCERRGIDLQHLEKVIDDGPAGRQFGALTAIRHLKGGYETSYIGEYAAKDWRHFVEMLDADELAAMSYVHVNVMESILSSRGTGPWI
jgi:3-hydroxyisobutyrate dehydrogenase-like beta-hydroxyacid dehydrogenase